MKILHVITSLRTGGAEKLMVDLIPRLKAKGHEVDLLLFDGERTQLYKDAKEAGINIYDLGIGGSVYSLSRLRKLRLFLKRYDIVHTHNTAPQFFASISGLFTKTKLITTEHNTSNRRRKWKLFKYIDRWMYNRYKTVICISQKAETNLREFIGSSKARILTINNGIDVKRYKSAQPSAVFESIAPKSKKIIMVAAFRWEKDQDTLIKAMQSLPDQFHLFLVGDGIRRNELTEIANSADLQDRVHFMGLRSDVPQLLHEADYIVMSSHFEGLSLSSIEGMSAGKPFIASNVDGLREVVDGAGILFPHQDHAALASAILKLDGNKEEYAKIARQCSMRADEFDISLMAENYANCYSTRQE